MSRLKRWLPIVDLAEKKEEDAVQALGLSQQKLEEARKGLENLKTFRQNYAEQFQQAGSQGFSIQQLNEYRAFLSKLNNAFSDQERLIERAEELVRQRKVAWEETHRNSLGVKKIQEKLQAEVVRKELKSEQAALDERSGRLGKKKASKLL